MGLAIVKDRIWPALNYIPNPAQAVIHKDPARHRVVAAGRRVGKSTCGGHELIPEVYRAHFNQARLSDLGIRMEFWIVGPNYTDAEKEFRVFYNDCKKLGLPFDRPGTYYDAKGGSMQVSLWGGKFLVTAKSAAHPESLVGEGLFGVVMAEAAKQKESTWTKYVRPTLADFEGWSIFNSTPEGKNWFYDLWVRGQNPADSSWSSHRFPSWYNTHVYPQGRKDPEILELAKDLTEEAFNQEIGAQFSDYVGRVFKDWDEEKHVGDFPYDPTLPVYLATDYGWTNPNVGLWIQKDIWDNLYVIGEYYERGRTDAEFAADLKEQFPGLVDVCREMYPDPEDPKASNTISRALRMQMRGGTGGERKIRLDLIRAWLKDVNPHLADDHPERHPKLRVDRRCRNFIREMDAYRYPDTKGEATLNAKEEPLKKDDHTPEALGRFMRGHFGESVEGGRARVRKANVRG
jgi:Terminase large subunit, T4likevirus-type, N-terminal